jgi:hypothetical protein
MVSGVELTSEHREILEAIGPNGVASEQLGDLDNSPAFAELDAADYIEPEEFPLRETTEEGGRMPDAPSVTYWHLTPLGTEALGVSSG